MVRQKLANVAMSRARAFGRALGCEIVVEISEHSIQTTMEHPDTDSRAWDDRLYKRGQVFVKGYANPVKPQVVESDDREQLDTLEVEEGEVDEEEDERLLELIPSTRYKEYLNQHLISELVNPREQWTLLIYGMIGLGGIMFLNIIITMWATGAF